MLGDVVGVVCRLRLTPPPVGRCAGPETLFFLVTRGLLLVFVLVRPEIVLFVLITGILVESIVPPEKVS